MVCAYVGTGLHTNVWYILIYLLSMLKADKDIYYDEENILYLLSVYNNS